MVAHLVNAAKRIKTVTTRNGLTFQMCADCGCWINRLSVCEHDCECHKSQHIITEESE